MAFSLNLCIATKFIEHGITVHSAKNTAFVSQGRPPKETTANREELKRKKKQMYDDGEVARIPIEGKFGEGKRRFGMGRIMAKLAATSETLIGLVFILINLLFCFLSVEKGFYAAGKDSRSTERGSKALEKRMDVLGLQREWNEDALF